MLSIIRFNILKGKKVLIDFTKTKIMVADGALIFYAEILRLIDIFPHAYSNLTCNIPASNRIREVLHQIGLLRILNPLCSASSKREDVVNWRAAYGKDADGESYDKILGHYQGQFASALGDDLYNGITEAMTNCTQHAYIAPRYDGLLVDAKYKSWWMFSQEKNGVLSVVFCDLGAGIPGTLPITSPNVWNKLVTLLGLEIKDSKVIDEAVQIKKTRTNLPNRGYGLHQMVELVNSFDGGEIVIHSNKGCYVNKDGAAQHYDFKRSILGTLIFWQVRVGEVTT